MQLLYYKYIYLFHHSIAENFQNESILKQKYIKIKKYSRVGAYPVDISGHGMKINRKKLQHAKH